MIKVKWKLKSHTKLNFSDFLLSHSFHLSEDSETKGNNAAKVDIHQTKKQESEKKTPSIVKKKPLNKDTATNTPSNPKKKEKKKSIPDTNHIQSGKIGDGKMKKAGFLKKKGFKNKKKGKK